ncbi:hypothetical protein MmiHf6_02670 [Methanimicrococcus hongohii]|uniref:Uncharacterized protein n=1 Tax=Methanimicrococcus hongohii TaxID=3028295 RepID=A0AA97A161_9EURY|nr:hypothetical protein [Methanimicrococcus sp. Hf6]WNY22973.1 hypothetical protein MmiHf6_02670 [Methanimicrococcus sp. Hf6]
MNYSKILLAALAVMLIFAVAPLASAGDGSEEDPYLILYVGNTGWDMIPLNGGATGIDEVNGIHYIIEYIDGYGAYNYTPTPPYEPWYEPSEDYLYLAEEDLFQYFDVMFIDMVNVPYDLDLNDSEQKDVYDVFVNAFTNAAAGNYTKIITLRTAPVNGNSVMPLSFDFIDTTAYTVNNSIPYVNNEPGARAFVSNFGPMATTHSDNWTTASVQDCENTIIWLDAYLALR